MNECKLSLYLVLSVLQMFISVSVFGFQPEVGRT